MQHPKSGMKQSQPMKLFNEKVAETKQAFDEYEEDQGFEVSDEVEPLGSEFSVQEEDTRTESEFAKPVITGGNFKPRAETLQTGDSVKAPAEEKSNPFI